MQLEELSEVWPDDTEQLAAVLEQRDPVVRHIAASVLALGADADAKVCAQLAQVCPACLAAALSDCYNGQQPCVQKTCSASAAATSISPLWSN